MKNEMIMKATQTVSTKNLTFSKTYFKVRAS
jgi:hypothetical protein